MIYCKSNFSVQIVGSHPFNDEKELENIVAECPTLLLSEDEAILYTVATQVRLGGGIADLVLLDKNMLLTVVEVKLRQNGESRRTIVGQVFDYVSSLAKHTFDELDELVEGKLSETLEKFEDERDDDGALDQRRVKCGANLRAGEVRVAVVIDEAPDELTRIMQYIADHSDVDVRLVSIDKHIGPDGALLFVPQILVRAEANKAVVSPSKEGVNEALAPVIEAFGTGPYAQLAMAGSGPTYRQIKIPNWPGLVHYEFMYLKTKQTLSAELHVEDPELKDLSSNLPEVARAVQSKIGEGIKVEHDAQWSKGRGRLRIVFAQHESPQNVANAMNKLIEVSQPIVAQFLQQPN